MAFPQKQIYSIQFKKGKYLHFTSCRDVENNFPHKLLLTNTQVSKLRKAFANNSSANIKLSKTQLHKIENNQEDF